MTSTPSDSQNPRALRALLLVLAVLATVAVLVATRLVSAGAIHHGQDTMRAVAALHRTTTDADAQGPLPVEYIYAEAAVPGDCQIAGWSPADVLGVHGVLLRVRRQPGGERSSLCVWPKTESFSSVRSSSRDVEGVRVDLWHDTHHIFARVRTLPPEQDTSRETE